MPQTILALNSESKLQTWEAIGQFGHGGSSALAFCESCLIVTQPRAGNAPEDFHWALIFPEAEPTESKQSVVFRWFADQDGLPLKDRVQSQLARGETETGSRTVEGAFFRLIDDRIGSRNAVEYRTGEKSQELIVDGVTFGNFSIFAFVLAPNAEVRN